MSYLPLARKYRPQSFADLVGQPHVTATLTKALETKRLGQAYLFAGQRGVGKTSAARILAKCLNCAAGPTPAPCQTCPSCVQITQGNSLDVIEIDGASNRGIDEIRSLRETVPFAPTSGPFRVYIIDEVHMLTAEAFNALLKTLEEPPAHVKFIFATTAPNKVPATILSRCQRFDFRRVEASTIVGALARIAKTEQIAASDAALYAIARAAEGSLRDAEVMLEQAASFVRGTLEERDVTALLGAIESEALVAWAGAILERQAPEALSLMTAQLEQGRDPLQLLTGLLRHLRNVLIVASIGDDPSQQAIVNQLVDEPPERLSRLREQAGRTSPQELLLFLQILTGAYELIRRSPMAQTILELAVIKLATREEWQSLADISRKLERLSTGPLAPPVTEPGHPAAGRVGDSHAETAGRGTTPPAASQAVLEVWPAFLERVGAQKMSLAAYLAHARPLGMEGTTLAIGVPGFALHQEVLSLTENRRLIERLLSELCGAAVAVRYVTVADESEPTPSAAGPEAPAPPIVQDIVNLFNATVIHRPGTA
jgi:DNA polymerase-3 subunit gamma/tau